MRRATSTKDRLYSVSFWQNKLSLTVTRMDSSKIISEFSSPQKMTMNVQGPYFELTNQVYELGVLICLIHFFLVYLRARVHDAPNIWMLIQL